MFFVEHPVVVLIWISDIHSGIKNVTNDYPPPSKYIGGGGGWVKEGDII